MKILVVGFQRSGTTLLRNVVENHPDVQKMFHEKFFLKFNKGQQKNMLAGLGDPEGTWGEKVPYYTRRIRRGVGMHIEEYVRRWFKMFKSEARVLHIIRHPLDVGLSSKKTFEIDFDNAVKTHIHVVPRVVNYLSDYDNCMQIKFEELVWMPASTVQKIYEFCKLEHNSKIVQKTINKGNYRLGRTKKPSGIIKDRAFVYIQEGIKYEKNLANAFEVLNTIPGPEYEVTK